MISRKIQVKIREFVAYLERFVDRIWYSPLLLLLCALDNFVVVIPTDGIVISSTMLKPRRWLFFGLSTAVGSTLGALLLALLVRDQGMSLIQDYYSGLTATEVWAWTQRFFSDYGLFLVFAVAASPVAQQPAVTLSALAETPMLKLFLVILAGRVLKYLIIGYLASHAPKVLVRFWGLRGDMEDAGVVLAEGNESQNPDKHPR
ncbi:MAG: hypothetical protein HC902_01405 [Calothrix sp. SM1_5_4]|nr:hypothetical protein [Calothrix sp. SM1_5_4]